MSIEVKHLSYVYSKGSPFEKTALDDVSFKIDDGEFIAVIGQTGSGKSTLIQHLNSLLVPTEGSVYVDGTDIFENKSALKDIRAKVGVVFQYPEHQLFEETVYKDIAFGPINLGFNDDDTKRLVEESLDFVGLDEDILQKSPFDLSGGQKRRVAIAGILAMNPRVLILDEPTAGLDPAAKNDLLSRLKLLHDSKKITIIIVSHSMEDVAQTVQKVMVMHNAKLVAYDTVSAIFSNTDMLRDAGLDIPQITSVMKKLKLQNIDINTNVFTVEKAADVLYNYITEGA